VKAAAVVPLGRRKWGVPVGDARNLITFDAQSGEQVWLVCRVLGSGGGRVSIPVLRSLCP
jgi:hypothetical protein